MSNQAIIQAGTPQDFKRNEPMGLDLGWLNHLHVNKAAADRRAASLANRRTVKKEYQAAWLVKAIELIDLTTLSGDDTPGRVERLCMKALRPLRTDLVDLHDVVAATEWLVTGDEPTRWTRAASDRAADTPAFSPPSTTAGGSRALTRADVGCFRPA